MQNNYKVYMHKFPNGKVYIGMTQQKPKRRWKGGSGYITQQDVKSAIDYYGWENIEHIILKENLSFKDAEYYERYYIARYKSNIPKFGYNQTIGGITSTKLNEQTCNKISKSRENIKFSNSHKQNLSKALSTYFNDNYEINKNQIEMMKYNDLVHSPRRLEVRCVETNKIYLSIRNAGKQTGIDYRRIAEVCHKKYGRKTAGGYHWEFYERSDD